ncbi:phospholipase A2 [Streptomyces lancefieldiae]|uniref:Phospholipase A2 n=1 Tax=Streptomyces lancefieldiae TaxID=3075520 RepID=A0ABU3AYU1_9ACTN|nr:phospholipase A2 [Streptomyces sp. DSM 40712]MDT0615352.1 phospholipase A2 [Streptomyces sp. DSM 40712]
MNTIEPLHDPQEPQRSVGLWRRFHGALRMVCLLAVGVLALGIAANAAPSNQPDGNGNPAAPVELEQIVATGKGVYGLSADHRGVYEWSPRQDGWKRVWGGATKLYAGGDNVYGTDPSTGSIWKYNGDGWDRIGNPGLTFAAADDKLYGISPDGSGVWEYSGKGDVWNKIGGPAKNLYVGPAADRKSFYDVRGRTALYATNGDASDLYQYSGEPEKWDKAGGPGVTFAATDENVYGLSPDGSVMERDLKKGEWNPVGDRAEHIFGSNALYAVNRDTRGLYKYAGKPHQWDSVSGPAAAFATGGHYLYRLALDRRSVQKYNGNGKTDEWLDLRAPAVPVPSEEKIARLNSFFQPGQESFNAWAKARGAHLVDKQPDPYELRWNHDGCSTSPDEPAGFDFKAACIRHDFGYRNYRDLLGEDGFRNGVAGMTGVGPHSPKTQVDAIFLQDLQKECHRPIGSGRYVQARPPLMVATCERIAAQYHASVVNLG